MLLDYTLSPSLSQYYTEERNLTQTADEQLKPADSRGRLGCLVFLWLASPQHREILDTDNIVQVVIYYSLVFTREKSVAIFYCSTILSKFDAFLWVCWCRIFEISILRIVYSCKIWKVLLFAQRRVGIMLFFNLWISAYLRCLV